MCLWRERMREPDPGMSEADVCGWMGGRDSRGDEGRVGSIVVDQ